ncbi:solute:Na+ symporter, SSS family [Cyclonatronum proteinivorum]|uniref:Sodium/proline symporter n=1 Tax=Cyclonatronum proteinivorum TaxID=1457365 RepID=A0A345UKW1_9BACT|nr:sodium/proline symporter [Cyclonatronum proteinivorum]AXJ01113.1 solute:Na+ symporter, SSS family [Cyclonatronum proteinivorum]
MTVTAEPLAIVSFIAYLILIILIGVYASRFSSQGISEYFVGGRRMNRFVVALSAVVSGRSAWLLLGVTGMAWSVGVQAVWSVMGYIIVEIWLFLYYARRLRRFAEVRNVITIPDFFAERFPAHEKLIRIVLVAIILIFMTGYVSAQFVAGGKTFVSGFGIDPFWGIAITALIVLTYTVVGGFLAVSLTDVLQGFLMLFSLVLLPLLLIVHLGGWAFVAGQLAAFDPLMLDPYALGLGAAIGGLAIGLGSPGNPHIISRYLSIENEAQLKTACMVGTLWNVLMAWGALFTGLAGRVLFPELSMLPEGDTENLFPHIAQTLLHPVFFGVIMASVFAAIMSSADSQLLVAASSLVRDVTEKMLGKGQHIPQERLVRLSRTVVVVLVLVSLFFAWVAQDLVFWLVLFAWAGLGAAIGPTSVLALYWKRTTGAGVVAGMLSGATVTIVWRLTDSLRAISYELIPGFIAGLLITVIVSLLTQPPADAEQQFDLLEGKSE